MAGRAAPPQYPETNQWLMAEDEALKELLTGLSMPGDKPGRSVPVYFRFPEAERQIVYPFITLDLIGIEPAYDLWTSEHAYDEQEVTFEDEYTGEAVSTGLYEPSVSRSIWTVPNTGLNPAMPFRRLHYLQYRLFYQVTTWAKTFAHDRILTSTLIRDLIHPRPSWLHVMADDTWRRMEPLGWVPADIPTQEGGMKRIFRKAFTLSVQSEIPQDYLPMIEQRAAITRVLLRGYFMDKPDEYWTEDETTDYWEVIAGPSREVVTTMTPGIYNLVLYRGDSYGWRFRVWQDKDRTLPTDLSGSTAAAQIRNAPGGAIVVNMDVDIEEPNIVNVRLTAAQSEALPPGGAWDLEITTDTNVRTVVKGDVTVQADVTT